MSDRAHVFAGDVEEALDRQPTSGGRALLLIVSGGLAAALAWAYVAVLDEVTHAEGKVIPSSQVQVVQSLDGGIISAIDVNEGQRVQAGQVLLRINDVDFASSLGELRQKRIALIARKARLEAEAEGRAPVFADAGNTAVVVEAELALYRARQASLVEETSVIRQQLEQRLLERTEISTRLAESRATALLAQRELELGRDLKRRGAFPEMDLLRLERQFRSEQRDIAVLEASLPRIDAAIAEARAKLEAAGLSFKARAGETLGETSATLAVIEETLRSAEDRVRRTTLRAPVNGIVNKLAVTTVGAVVRPGERIVDIVPIDDSLLVEARVRPQDVAFIRPGQPASVKVTAYDYTIYGELKGAVERIGADTIPDEKGNAFYRVIVRTERSNLGTADDPQPIIPGMVVSADIQTGRKSVLEYLFRPIKVAGREALRER